MSKFDHKDNIGRKMTTNKQYGLILPKKLEQKPVKFINVFGDDDVSDEDGGTDWFEKAILAGGKQHKIKKQTKLDIQKAFDEDSTIYQYDEVYDVMEQTKIKAVANKNKDKKPRYIGNLLKTAERRKKEQEHRIERMVQKEREAEGEMYADKESFVTSAYRTKLEEFKKREEEEDKMSRLEAVGDVTKQQDMSGFYRHLYEQTVNCQDQGNNDKSSTTQKKDTAPEKSKKRRISADNPDKAREKRTNEATNTTERSRAIAKHKKPSQYRHRAVEKYECDPESEASKEDMQQNQTIISSINEGTLKIQEPEKKKQKYDVSDVETDKHSTDTKTEDSRMEDGKTPQDSKEIVPGNENVVTERKAVDKEDRSSSWEKRTTDSVFETALKRYYARKAARLVSV